MFWLVGVLWLFFFAWLVGFVFWQYLKGNFKGGFISRCASYSLPSELGLLQGCSWSYSKASWATGSRGPCLIRGVTVGDLQRSLQPQPHCDSVACCSLHGADLDHMSLSSCSVRAFTAVCSLSSVLYLGWDSRIISVKAALWDRTMLPSPELFLNVLPWPLFSHCAQSSNWMNLLGLLRNVLELPPRDWEIV